MNYTKAIYLMSGEVITITEVQEQTVKKLLAAGAEWVDIEGQFINSKSIAKIGSHHVTVEMKRLEKYQAETDLKIAESDKKLIA